MFIQDILCPQLFQWNFQYIYYTGTKFFFAKYSDVTYNHSQSSIQIKAQVGVYFMEYGIGSHNACGFN